MKGRDENYLCNATKKALEILSNNAAGSKKGFMVMIEGSQIDSEGHANNAEGILAETRDFERLSALRWILPTPIPARWSS